MITYKDNLKLKLEKLQKAIDDISNINYGIIKRSSFNVQIYRCNIIDSMP